MSDCGCKICQGSAPGIDQCEHGRFTDHIEYCLLHKAAGELLKACKALMGVVRYYPGDTNRPRQGRRAEVTEMQCKLCGNEGFGTKIHVIKHVLQSHSEANGSLRDAKFIVDGWELPAHDPTPLERQAEAGRKLAEMVLDPSNCLVGRSEFAHLVAKAREVLGVKP